MRESILTLNPGKRLGPYEIVEAIGAGGMGQVYRGVDTRLDRTVAIKVLPPETAGRAEARERFEREAKAVSALNHPHICVLHDVGRQDDIDFIVMEYLEGETLADRLARGRIPLDEAIEYAMQIADALDKAHRQGVVHRDLKPGNIMITRSGTKLLDFGLAKLRQPDRSPSLAQSGIPTQASDLTAQGMILGTIQYMSPEQLEGGDVDARSDIFAFGAVLYEMVTGRKAFQGKSAVSVMAAILEHDPPPITASEHLAPPMLDYVVKTCLAKNPEKRWQTAGDLTLQLRWISEAGPAAAAPAAASAPRRWIERAAWSVALASALGVLVATVFWREEPDALPTMQFEIPTPNAISLLQIAVSPDGRHVVSVATSEKGQALWLHSFEHSNGRFLKETEWSGSDAGPDPFWSPD
ncbi:MAG: serine/threonine protein kinase, partial [Acidobacteria bacterium]|nr:serine/threonine protein kinase [Acidobacteriota bacterium]